MMWGDEEDEGDNGFERRKKIKYQKFLSPVTCHLPPN
ncbi:hypothetical protein Anacy_0023 [Anabaena cylindrica PCC 7122]|uniref:Uncharacterized protein n=1 Tax=Anabaena cylindrica (strain ATCC 27899 / PCC 7122) TaxID=272123 RepID=K9Z8W3_ANACC|nr:hypothetical protein Anacy_0023 [Anabaena cylindrica PCC 7122]BAY01947.1 hypothetical protein NIES19_11830 [Anabaena cylindrica PCC 7122]